MAKVETQSGCPCIIIHSKIQSTITIAVDGNFPTICMLEQDMAKFRKGDTIIHITAHNSKGW